MTRQEFEYKNDSKAAIKKLRQICKEIGTKEVGVRIRTDIWSSIGLDIPIKYACEYISKVASEVRGHRDYYWVQTADLEITISKTKYHVYVKAVNEVTRTPNDEEEE